MAVANLFERLNREQTPTVAAPSPEIIRMGPATAIIPPAGPKADPTEKLLDWLINRWVKPTISLREICRYGPNATRDWESATNLSKILVERGWLTPNKTRRRDMREWQVIRGSNR
jgi:hypothetical protein